MRVLLSAATYDLQPSHLYLQNGGGGGAGQAAPH